MWVWETVGYAGSLIGGGLAGMVVERSTGWMGRTIGNARSQSTQRKRLKRTGRSGEFLTLDDDLLYVLQHVPKGWNSNHIEFVMLNGMTDAVTNLDGADEVKLPKPRSEIGRLIDEERRRLADRPDGEWNGPSLAISRISVVDRTPGLELPVLRCTVYESDHASARVCSSIWQGHFDASAKDELMDTSFELLPGMVQAIGLNATLVTSDNQLILVRRSDRISSGRSGWHISVNEGMLPTDEFEGRLSPAVGLARGVHEELGLTISPSQIKLHTAMMDVTRYQFGLLGHIDLSNERGRAAADFVQARRAGRPSDRLENVQLEAIPWSIEAVCSKLQEPDWIAHGWLNLAMSALAEWPKAESRIFDLMERRAGS